MAMFDLVRVQTSTTGTGAIVAGAAVDGGRTPVAAGLPDGWTGSYAIEDAGQREVGQTAWNATAGTFTRSMTASTTGSLLNLSGAAKFSLTALAADFATPNKPVLINAPLAGTWVLPHGLGRKPMVQLFLSSGEQVLADVTVDNTNINAVFAEPTQGFALAY